jgi:hypothetical protein
MGCLLRSMLQQQGTAQPTLSLKLTAVLFAPALGSKAGMQSWRTQHVQLPSAAAIVLPVLRRLSRLQFATLLTTLLHPRLLLSA